MSRNSRCNFAPTGVIAGPWVNCMVIFTRLPERSTDPSMTPSAFNSLAISGRVFVLFLTYELRSRKSHSDC